MSQLFEITYGQKQTSVNTDNLGMREMQARVYAKRLHQQLLEQYQLLVDYTAINAAAHPEKAYLASLRDDLNSIRKLYKTVKAAKVGEAEEIKGKEE